MCFSMPDAMSSIVIAGPVACPVGNVVHEDISTARLTWLARIIAHRAVIAFFFQEPCGTGRESAHSSLDKFEPTHAGCAQPEPIHRSEACAKTKGRIAATALVQQTLPRPISAARDFAEARWCQDAPFEDALPVGVRPYACTPRASGLKQNISSVTL